MSNRIAMSDDIQNLTETNKAIAAALQVLAGTQMEALPTSISRVREIVRMGLAPKVFSPGDRLYVPWTDYDNSNKEYTVRLDIGCFKDVTLQTGEVVPAMGVKWHYGIPFDMPFDAQEAFYFAESGLAAGTYNITVGANWGTYCKNGETYQFTLTQPVPEGGQLVGFYGMPDTAPSSWKVSSYVDGNALTAIETVAVTAGNGGTNLGSFTPAGSGDMNSLHRLAYGSGRWGQSFLRQWLNSTGTGWFKLSNKFDRIPAASYSGKHGFMSGFGDEFLSCVGKAKVTTALNTVNESSEGTSEDTFDTFFPLSLEEAYIKPQISGIEGDVWPLCRRERGQNAPATWYMAGEAPILTGIENTTATRYNRLRSASRGSACNARYVYPSGYVSGYGAVGALRCAPACWIY